MTEAAEEYLEQLPEADPEPEAPETPAPAKGAKGVKRSEETKAKMSASQRAAWAKRKATQAMGGGSDPEPKRRAGAKPKPAPKVDPAELQNTVQMALAMAATAAYARHRCMYCLDRQTSEAPLTAAKLVEMAAHNPALLQALEALHRALGVAGPLSIIVAWVAVPIVHHAPMPEALQMDARRALEIPPEADAMVGETFAEHFHDDAAPQYGPPDVVESEPNGYVPPPEPSGPEYHPGAAAPGS